MRTRTRSCAGASPKQPPPRIHPARVRPVLALLDDADATVVEAAAWACGELTGTDPRSQRAAVERLTLLATEHEDALVREAAVAALGSIGDAGGLQAILAATSDKPAVRRRAVLALAPFEGPEVDARWQRRSRRIRDWQVASAAEDLL